MQTKDHLRLGKYLIDNVEDNFISESTMLKLAFLWGNIQPDVNCFTYFHGFMKYKDMRGHNFKNMKSVMKRLFKLMEEPSRNIIWYYRLGKLMHYLADSFTYPHNDEFLGDLKHHVMYEEELHQKFDVIISNIKGEKLEQELIDDLWYRVKDVHREYIESRRNQTDDLKYIVDVTSKIFSILSKNENTAQLV